MAAQVLIVGAGPVGLTQAIELTRYQVKVRIIEKAAARTDKSKALVMWSRTLELLDRNGIAQNFVSVGKKINSAKVRSGQSLIAKIRLGKIQTEFSYALMIPQSETERLLEEHLLSLGIKVERQVELLDFKDEGQAVESKILHADGTTETLRTDWLIASDGAHSTVRKKLNLPFIGDTLEYGFMLADVKLTGENVNHDEISMFWHEDGVLVFFPFANGRFRVVADAGVLKPGDSRKDPSVSDIQAIIDRRGLGGITISDPVWLAAFGINERMVKEYSVGRIFLTGDAAHIHSPAGGQGMNTGMQDAFNLAWKLALQIHGDSKSGALLKSYSVERSGIGKKVLASTTKLTRVAILENKLAQKIRNLVMHRVLNFPLVQKAISKQITGLSVAYPHSPINGEALLGSGKPTVGERVVPRPNEIPVGSGDRPKFAVFADASDEAKLLCLKYPNLLEADMRAPLKKGAIHLVRPDGYVALIAKAGHWESLDSYLQKI